jgi:predicted TIM-barrel fold metal-dependent hydrolase
MTMFSRRRFLRTGAAAVGALATRGAWAQDQPGQTEVIDMHVHLLRKMSAPFIYRDNPLVSHWTWHEHNGDLFVQEMNVAGVDRALLKTFNGIDIAYALKEDFNGSPEDFDSGEAYMLTYRDKYPDRFIWSATVNPTIPDFRNVWTAKFANGLKAIVLFPGLQDHRLDHPDVLWLLDECRKRGLKGIQMSFENVTRKNTSADYVKQLYAMIERYPTLHFDFLHGAYQVPHSLEREPTLELMRHFNDKTNNVWAQTDTYYVDTKYPFPAQLAGTRELFDRIGPEKIIWGTDWPWIETTGKYSQFLQSVDENCTYMTAAQKARYLGGNALECLGLPANPKRKKSA